MNNIQSPILQSGRDPLFTSSNGTMQRVLQLCQKISNVDSTVLILGESGTGKSVLAQYIHNLSSRKQRPFLTINCASIPESLLESELFGYSVGAFTGALKHGKIGLIEAANHGTLFLDEIGELPLQMQAKLLHVIQHQEYIPLREIKPKKVNVRIIAATNRDLYEMVIKKQFREDLYYRLNVIDIKVPSLRERTEDIIPLATFFLLKNSSRFGISCKITEEALHLLETYSWPGNIRQLENLIEKLVVTADHLIDVQNLMEHFNPVAKASVSQAFPSSLEAAMEEVEKKLVTELYENLKSSRKVADVLKVSQTKAYQLIRKYCTLS